MAITVSAYTTLDKIANIKSKPERREALRKELESNAPLATYIQYVYHPDVVFDLPEGEPPFKAATHDDYAAFYRNVKKLVNFSVGSPVTRKRKELLWQGLMEMVTALDAPLLTAVKDKRLPWRTLNKKFVVHAIPELYPSETVQEEELTAEEE